jgi:hypothetical protein
MPFEALDPSLALGFYCKTKDEFQEFCNFIDEVVFGVYLFLMYAFSWWRIVMVHRFLL